MKKALITGITGQDGSYMAEILLQKGYEVHGLVRHVALERPMERMSRINHLKNEITLHGGSLESYSSILKVMANVLPDEVYHFAAQSFVAKSFDDGFSTFQTNITGTYHVFEAVKGICSDAKVYFAASSEMFGNAPSPQTEQTPMIPRSPYGISKLTGYHLARNFRESYNMFVCNGILFNHESPRRGLNFVTRKITNAVARIKQGKQKKLVLGNLDAKRDWGYARDYMDAIYAMMQQDKPDDYVISTNRTHSVKEFCDIAFEYVGLLADKYIEVDEKFMRPAEIHELKGDASKAEQQLGWFPETCFEKLIEMMVEEDLKREELR